jgi:hypothetical protein
MRVLLRVSTGMLAFGLVTAQAQIVNPVNPSAAPPDGPIAAPPPPADTDNEVLPRLMDDTAEYCEELRIDIAQIRATRREIPPDAAMLTREGERMCRIGHIRPGIYRLRTALMMLRQGG